MDYNSLISAASFSPRYLYSPNAGVGHLPFSSWLIKEINPKIFVELGTHSGNSYFSFCQAVQEEKLSTYCYAVDTWQGDEYAGFYEEIYSQVNAHNQKHYAGFSRLLRMTFDVATEYFADETIELLHIDGLHTYEAVKHNFEKWLPKLAPGALVIFHDTNVRENSFGVWKFWKELQPKYPLNLEFIHSHGLGVIQISNDSVEKQLTWLTSESPEQQKLKFYFAALGSRQSERFDFRHFQEEYEKAIDVLNQSLAERDNMIARLNQSVNDFNLIIAGQNQTTNQFNHTIIENNAQIVNLNDSINSRDERIINLNQMLIANTEQISDLNYAVTQYEKEVSNTVPLDQHKQQVFNYEEQISNLVRDQEKLINSFHNTRTWRLTEPFRSAANIARGFRSKYLRESQNSIAGEPLIPEEAYSELQAEESSTSLSENQITSHIRQNQTYQHRVAAIAAGYRLGTKPVVVFITHNLGGETEKHLQELSRFLTENGARILILRPGKENEVVLESFDSEDKLQLDLAAYNLELLSETLKTFGIKKIHIHHTIGFDFSIEELITLMQIPYDYTVNDYFSICPGVTPADTDFKYCEVLSPNDCGFCSSLDTASLVDHSDIDWWRLKFASLLNGAERVICFNQEAADQIAKVYPSAPIIVVPHREIIAPADISADLSSNSSTVETRLINSFYNSDEYWEPEGKKSTLPTLLLIPEMHGSIPSPCAYIRLIKPLMSDTIQKKFKLRVSNLKESLNLHPDIIVINRLPCSDLSELEAFLKNVKAIKAKLIYDIDDNLLFLHDNHPEKDYYKTKESIVLSLLNNSDCVWTSTHKLATYLQPYCNEIIIFENYLDESFFETKKQNNLSGGRFKILYMGTSSHKKDLSQVMVALRELFAKGLDFELNLIGINDDRLVEEWVKVLTPVAEASNYPNFMRWLKTLDHFDLGIAPLEKSLFNECKSDIKFWDYTAMGVPILASNIGAYSLIIEDGRNGLLAENLADIWMKKIIWAANNRNQLANLVENAADDLRNLSLHYSAKSNRESYLLKIIEN